MKLRNPQTAGIEDREVRGNGARARVFTLLTALRNTDQAVREAAAESLGDLGADAAVCIPLLRQAMRDRRVRRKVSRSLERIRAETRVAGALAA